MRARNTLAFAGRQISGRRVPALKGIVARLTKAAFRSKHRKEPLPDGARSQRCTEGFCGTPSASLRGLFGVGAIASACRLLQTALACYHYPGFHRSRRTDGSNRLASPVAIRARLIPVPRSRMIFGSSSASWARMSALFSVLCVRRSFRVFSSPWRRPRVPYGLVGSQRCVYLLSRSGSTG